MGYVPAFIDVTGARCVVIGGTRDAEFKVASLLDARAVVTVISPELCPELRHRADSGEITHLPREYRDGDLIGSTIIYAVVADRDLRRRIRADAERAGILVNISDAPESCSFIAPAVVRRGPLQIAISTSGASPALARRIKEELSAAFGPEYEVLLEILLKVRRWLKANEKDAEVRAARLESLVDSGIEAMVADGDYVGVRATIRRVLGHDVPLEDLSGAPN